MTLYEHPLKNAYIGGYYEYSYDFRNKTTTNLANDGWTTVSGTPTFGTYGLYSSGSGNPVRLKKAIPGGLANATKIKLECTARAYTGCALSWGVAKTVTSSVREGITRVYQSSSSNTWAVTIYDTDNTYSESISSGTTITSSLVVDLDGKTFLAKMTGKSDKTGTLTDTQVSNIRNNTTVLFPYIDGPNSSCGLTTVSIAVEK